MVFYVARENVLELSKELGRKTLWVPILSDQAAHYLQNRISFIYIYSFDTGDEYIVGVNSVDLDHIDLEYFLGILPPGHRIVYNAKYLSPFDFECVDANMLVWYYTNNQIITDNITAKIFTIYRDRYPGMANLNDVVPVMRMLEYVRDIRNQFIQHYIEHADDDGYQFYETVYRKNLVRMERIPITVDPDKYAAYTGRALKDNKVYTEYNPYTATGRPSNTAEGINFNSLNKTDGSREMIISRFENGRLFEFDYDSYHPRLIANIIGYTFPEGNVHEYLGKQYFDTNYITPELYAQSKRITFKQLYGGVSPEYQHIEFLQYVDKFSDGMWDVYLRDGYFLSPLSKRKFYASWFTDMTKMKMMNYIIQCVETEMNMMVLDKILEYLYHINSNIILYTYDAILIDFDSTDHRNVLKDVKSLMSKFGYPVNVKAGLNYHEMVNVTLY